LSGSPTVTEVFFGNLAVAASFMRFCSLWRVPSRLDVRNAVDSPTAGHLNAGFIAFEDDADAMGAVFHGAHGHFCPFWDLKAGSRMARDGGGPGVLTDLDSEPLSAAQLEAAPA
jgi:enoyl-CoA hydratase/carnithine racemase